MKTSKKDILSKLVWNRKPEYYQDTTAVYSKMRDHFCYIPIRKYIVNVKNMLEVGCGNGSVLHGLKTLHPSIEAWGIDISKLAIRTAKSTYKQSLHVQVQDAETFSISKKFDLVYSFFTFEHLDQPAKVLDRMTKHVNKNGYLYIVCPNYGSLIYPSPCNTLSWMDRVIFSVKRDIGLLLKKKITTLEWKEVDPIIDLSMHHRMDQDTTIEPYIFSLEAYVRQKYPMFRILLAESGWWSAGFGSASVKFVVATIPLRILSFFNITPFQFWGPRCILLLQKK